MDTIEKIQGLLPTLSIWNTNATCLYEQAKRHNISEADRFESSFEASTAFIREISNLKYFNQGFYLVCYDEKERLQGCMLLNPPSQAGVVYEKLPPSYLVIDLLMINPINIKSSSLNTTRQISGIGTSLMKKAEKFGKKNGAITLILHSDPSAIGFYERLGFETVCGFMKRQLQNYGPSKNR